MVKPMIRRALFLVLFLLAFSPAQAQEGLNLPADLYVLLNDGEIQRYGAGAAGVINLTPPGIFIVDFGVDSMGERLAFRTESALFVINIGSGGDTQQIEGTTADVPAYRGVGRSIAWSPAGDALAYTTTYGARVYLENGGAPVFLDLREGVFKDLLWSPTGRFLAAEAESADPQAQNVWWIYRRDAASLALTSVITSGVGVAWVSDGELVFAPAEGGLRLMNLDQANAQVELLDASLTYRLPELNTDGALVFFGRDPNDPALPDGYGRLLRLSRGAQQLETVGQVPVALNGLRWAPGGSLLVAFQGGVLALYDPSTGLGFPLPMSDVVAYDWGPPGQPGMIAVVPTPAPVTLTATEAPTATAPVSTSVPPTPAPVSTVNALTLAADSFFLAPDPRGIVQVWRMLSNGTPPQPFTGSGSDVNEFAASPDGSSVAYVVDAELWLQQQNAQPALMARLSSFAPVEADFSSDGTSLAYVDERSGVWLNVIEEDAPQLVRANDSTPGNATTYHRPQFSPDGTRLLLDVYDSAGVSIGVLDLATREIVEVLPAAPDDPRPARARWLRDGRIYSVVDSGSSSSIAPGFYVFDAAAPQTTPAQWVALPADVTVRSSVEAVGGTLRVLLAHSSDAFAPLSIVDYDLSNGESFPVLDIGAVIAPQLSPEGRFVGGYESLTVIDGVQQGGLLVVDLQSGRRFLLNNPPTAWGFRWGAP